MEKTATLNLRINPTTKKDAETILSKLGISMSAAINLYLNQIILEGGIPFDVKVPRPPKSIDMSQMTKEEFDAKILKGYEDAMNGRVMSLDEFYKKFKEENYKK